MAPECLEKWAGEVVGLISGSKYELEAIVDETLRVICAEFQKLSSVIFFLWPE